ncbi:hypothetical protein [Pararhizobium mangrovi]|uniref:Uncharacterized protein n=1 Tax=Pararhizobium mangrovi TaxID=2590452 RepID=A0A506U699_9HYPH|nr:hypothetical protein [Pararhizobium mangrovi]TPW28129.1 hypothetical protein FJU11_09695 [Pararhizobium mangrovi]
MPQLLVIAGFGALAWYGYQRFVKEAERVSRAVRRAEKETETGAIGTLVRDPVTGEYRVAAKEAD